MRRGNPAVYLIAYYLLWCACRRQAVLEGPIAEACQRLLEQTCAARGWEILDLVVHPDQVRLFVRVRPHTAARTVVTVCKRATAQQLRQTYAQLRALPSVWTRSYFAHTAGTVAPQAIDHYLAAQDAQKGNAYGEETLL